jgi:hypothetical protein
LSLCKKKKLFSVQAKIIKNAFNKTQKRKKRLREYNLLFRRKFLRFRKGYRKGIIRLIVNRKFYKARRKKLAARQWPSKKFRRRRYNS